MSRPKRPRGEVRSAESAPAPNGAGVADGRAAVGAAIALSALSGVIDFLGFVGFGLFPLAWFAWVPVLVAVRRENLKRTFGYGLIFGTVGHVGGYYWISTMLSQFGGISVPVAYLGLLLMCAQMGLMFALLLVLVRWAERTLGLAPIWTMVIAYPAIEFAFPLLFPYYIGNSQYRFIALTQIVELTGMLGLTVVIALLNGAFYELAAARLEKRKIAWRRPAVATGVFAVFVIYGLVRLPMIDRQIEEAKKLRVVMVQTNLGARDKAGRREEFIRRHIEMSRAAAIAHPDADLIVWPETAYNSRLPRSETNVAARVFQGFNKTLLFGALTVSESEGRTDIYNSAILTSSTGDVLSRFDKVELLAFGETIPFVETFPSIRKYFPRSSTFARGTTFENLKLGETTFLPMICYEDIFPSFVRSFWHTAGPPQVLVNITNDSWYGDSHEPWIHLVLATFRSIETRRALIRATNTGVSAFVDPAGRITAHTGQWTQETLVGDVPLIAGGAATLYMKAGDWLGWIALLGTAALIFRIVRAPRR